MVDENQLISPANYLAHAGDVDWVQHYASVDKRKILEPDVAGDLFLVWTGLKFEDYVQGISHTGTHTILWVYQSEVVQFLILVYYF